MDTAIFLQYRNFLSIVTIILFFFLLECCKHHTKNLLHVRTEPKKARGKIIDRNYQLKNLYLIGNYMILEMEGTRKPEDNGFVKKSIE